LPWRRSARGARSGGLTPEWARPLEDGRAPTSQAMFEGLPTVGAAADVSRCRLGAHQRADGLATGRGNLAPAGPSTSGSARRVRGKSMPSERTGAPRCRRTTRRTSAPPAPLPRARRRQVVPPDLAQFRVSGDSTRWRCSGELRVESGRRPRVGETLGAAGDSRRFEAPCGSRARRRAGWRSMLVSSRRAWRSIASHGDNLTLN
jgi:hypothetical protein